MFRACGYKRQKAGYCIFIAFLLLLFSILVAVVIQLWTGSCSPLPSQTMEEMLPATSLILCLWGQPLLKPGGCELTVKPVAAFTCSIPLF